MLKNLSIKSRTQKQIGLLSLLIIADQLSKWWIEQQPLFFQTVVIDGFFNIVKAHNFGVAFSMFNDWNHAWRTNLLLGVTIGIAIVVAIWWWRERKRPGIDSWLLILILSGAIGNIWDRFTLGYVVDFIQWYIVIDGTAYYCPAFNVADASISVAVTLMVIFSFKKS
ncbi:MAG: signal peptidase II [Mariprofundaceae bacterium]